MKGFGIYVKNDLLTFEHYQSMGVSIWLYLWLLDKITSINEKGIGLVLGGKPVVYDDLFKEMKIPRSNYDRYVQTLRDRGYIKTTRTPYGLVFRIIKAEKIFKNRLVKNEQSENNSDYSEMNNQSPENEQSLTENEQSNKTIQLDNTKTIQGPHKKSKKKINKPQGAYNLYNFWRIVNKIKGIPPKAIENKGAAEWIFNNKGESKGMIAISFAREALDDLISGEYDDLYPPGIYNLLDLRDKWDMLQRYHGRKQRKIKSKQKVPTSSLPEVKQTPEERQRAREACDKLREELKKKFII